MTLPVADGPWWKHTKLSDGITLFEEPFVDPWLQPNSWLVEGRDRNLLVDSGMGLVSLKDALGPLTGKPVLAVASHTHFDHVGSHHEFAERACHSSETDILAAPTIPNTAADVMDSLMITALPYEGYDTESYHIKAAPVTRALDEGDVIDLGDRVLKVLHLPGHSRGSIGLLEEATGVFFSGDVVYEGEILDELFSSDIDDYIETMRRLTELPVNVVHAGHYGSFGRERMVELVSTYVESKQAPVCPADAPRPA